MSITKRLSYPDGFYKTVERVKDCRFVCESCLQNKDGKWVNSPAAFFYTREPHPDTGSRYFALWQSGWSDKWIISDGQIIEEQDITGIVSESGEVIYSRYRHDYVDSYDRSVSIDGGRDYVKTSGKGRTVSLVVREGKLFVKPNQSDF